MNKCPWIKRDWMDPWTPNHFLRRKKGLEPQRCAFVQKPKPVSPFPYPLSILASARKQEIAFTIKISTSPISQSCEEFYIRTQNQRGLLHVTGWGAPSQLKAKGIRVYTPGSGGLSWGTWSETLEWWVWVTKIRVITFCP